MDELDTLVEWVVGLIVAAVVIGSLWAILGLFIGVALKAAQWVIAL